MMNEAECQCGHRYEQHSGSGGACGNPGCFCPEFRYDPDSLANEELERNLAGKEQHDDEG